jgi:hypothetical protein
MKWGMAIGQTNRCWERNLGLKDERKELKTNKLGSLV